MGQGIWWATFGESNLMTRGAQFDGTRNLVSDIWWEKFNDPRSAIWRAEFGELNVLRHGCHFVSKIYGCYSMSEISSYEQTNLDDRNFTENTWWLKLHDDERNLKIEPSRRTLDDRIIYQSWTKFDERNFTRDSKTDRKSENTRRNEPQNEDPGKQSSKSLYRSDPTVWSQLAL